MTDKLFCLYIEIIIILQEFGLSEIMEGLTGIKVGMTRYFTTEGIAVPVTLIKIEPHRITQIKTLKTDGYYAIQVTSGIKKRSRVLKPEAGHFVKSGIEVGKRLWEFRYAVNSNSNKNLVKVGDLMTVSLFSTIQKVDITGVSKGKGFSGTIKRWNFHSQDASHGNSLSHRAPGSIGQNQTPGRVFKGKKMAGQLGNIRVTIQNLDVMHVDVENNVLLVKGSIPGEIDSVVRVRKSFKKRE